MNREQNLDAVRIISCIRVIMSHIAAFYLIFEKPGFNFTVGNFFHSISVGGIIPFIMISGAFMLDNQNNKDYKNFYQKTFKKIVVPTLIWSFVYVFYNLLKILLMHVIGKNVSMKDYLHPFILLLKGKPYYHMWYLYMIIGMYMITPIIIRILEDFNEKTILRLGWGLVFLGMIINVTSVLIWPILFIQYLGFFILGYFYRKYYYKNPNRSLKYFIAAILSSLSVFFIVEILTKLSSLSLLKPQFLIWLTNHRSYFYNVLSPLIVFSSICLFIAFLNLKNFNINLKFITKYTFLIYVMHAGIFGIIKFVIFDILKKNPNPLWFIPSMTIVVFCSSWLLSIFLEYIRKIMYRHNILKKFIQAN